MEGFEAIPSVLGPLSSTVDGLAIFMKAVLDARPWRFDPVALHMPWNETAYNLSEHGGMGGKLCFAFMKVSFLVIQIPFCNFLMRTVARRTTEFAAQCPPTIAHSRWSRKRWLPQATAVCPVLLSRLGVR